MDLKEENLRSFIKDKSLLGKILVLRNAWEEERLEIEREKKSRNKDSQIQIPNCGSCGLTTLISKPLDTLMKNKDDTEDTSSSDESLCPSEISIDEVRIRDPKGKQMMQERWEELVYNVAFPDLINRLHTKEKVTVDEKYPSCNHELEGDGRKTVGNMKGQSKERIKSSGKRPSTYYHGERDSVIYGRYKIGIYRMCHGVIYLGEMLDDCFHGRGMLRYPNGDRIEGIWYHGHLRQNRITFHDGLRYKKKNWDYCRPPDRRFHLERLYGLRPAGRCHLTPDYPRREIPEGCYDIVDGYFDPSTLCVYSKDTGKVIRIPSRKEATWIMEHGYKEKNDNFNIGLEIFEGIDDLDDLEKLLPPRKLVTEPDEEIKVIIPPLEISRIYGAERLDDSTTIRENEEPIKEVQEEISNATSTSQIEQNFEQFIITRNYMKILIRLIILSRLKSFYKKLCHCYGIIVGNWSLPEELLRGNQSSSDHENN